MMRIGIDCRFWGIAHAGLGRYTSEIVKELLEINNQKNKDKRHKFVLFFQKNADLTQEKDLFEKYKETIEKVEVDIPHYSVKEQFLLGQIVDNKKLDLMHWMHFNKPIPSKTPYVVTIHDLIKHTFVGKEVTTRTTPVYWMKHFGYRLVIWHSALFAKAIIVPSKFTEEQIHKEYPNLETPMKVIYEGVSDPYIQTISLPIEKTKKHQEVLEKYKLTGPFFIYTGAAYPSKDIPTLLHAIQELDTKTKLVISCARNYFWEKLQKTVKDMNLEKQVVLAGKIPDEDLKLLYQSATAFVMPSKIEGFGLPVLEAMASGCRAISSDSSCLPEIYEDAVTYFPAGDSEKLREKLHETLTTPTQEIESILKKGLIQARKYQWKTTAQEILKVYNEILEQGK